MKTVKATLIVLAVLALVGVIIRIGYMSIQSHNEKERLQDVLYSADTKYSIYLQQAEECNCFPADELSEWKSKLKNLHTTTDEFMTYEYEAQVAVFKDSVFSKRWANGDFD